MRLHAHPLSTCSRRVRLVAHHLGVALELVAVDLAQGEQMRPAFLALNPNHKVPVLEDDGWVLWESYAIMQYLADITEGQTLYPRAARARADVNRWLFWCAQEFMPGVTVLNWENHIRSLAGAGPADTAEVQRGEALLSAAAAVLDAHLAQRQWVSGDALSLADFAIAAPLADQHTARMPVHGLAHVQRWLAQVQALDAWRDTAPR